MSEHSKGKEQIEEVVNDVKFRQRNTTWPDVLVNASSADELMWKGSRRITRTQRVGVGIFGLFFVLGGVSIVGSFRGEGWWIGIPIALGSVAVGCKLLWNSTRKNDPAKVSTEDER
jgi:hypothetical protein